MLKYGLLGAKLAHSYSKLIHEKIYRLKDVNASYDLIETNEDELEKVLDKLRTKEYSGYNVTIPYKTTVIKYLDELTEEAKKINSVNTIKLIDNKLVGYNTDYEGFKYLLLDTKLNLTSNFYILGNSATAKTVSSVLTDLNIKNQIVSRTKSINTITYDELKITNKDILVNTTPVGMYPNNDSILSKDVVSEAQGVIDLIYNPTITKFMSYNKDSYNGLLMLIRQAILSDEIFFNKKLNLDISIISKYILKEIEHE
ncbi:MAG: shikimate dehydrogenase family protein [Anaeroplasmataceae bacterium]